jgi:choline dehydrogenase-like flavoprotein
VSATLEADLCVIGAGAAGLTVATQLAAAGRSVIVLERGTKRAGKKAHADNRFDSVGAPLGPPSNTRRFALGGAGRMWGHTLAELTTADLGPASWRDFAWPFGRSELDPYTERARTLLSAEPGGEVGVEAPTPEVVVAHFTRSPVTFPLPDALPDGLDLRLGVRTTRLIAREGTVVRAEARDQRGRTFEVAAHRFVLAAGAIENAVLLLVSGLGTYHVGRHFAEHPQILVPIGRRHSEVAGRIPPGLSHPPGGAWVLAETLREREALPGAAAYLVPHREPALWSKPRVLAAGTLFHALYHRDLPPQPLRTLGRTLAAFPDLIRVARSRRDDPHLALRVTLETVPDPESRVTLSSTTDRFGIPLPRIDWRIGPGTARSLQRLIQAMPAVADQGGWGPLAIPADLGWPAQMTPGAHHIGTTRMAADPGKGVVDPNCRIHGLDNAFVAGSSVFPTSGWANPLLTIVALAVRLSDHLVAEVAERPTARS